MQWQVYHVFNQEENARRRKKEPNKYVFPTGVGENREGGSGGRKYRNSVEEAKYFNAFLKMYVILKTINAS